MSVARSTAVRLALAPARFLARQGKRGAHVASAVCRGVFKLVEVDGPRRPVIAIALIEHMGDLVACQPFASQARKLYPDAWIVWIVRPQYQCLVERFPDVDATRVVHCLTEWMILRRSAAFDIVIDLHFEARVCSTCRFPLAKLAGDRNVTVQSYYYYGNLLQAYSIGCGLSVIDDQPRLMRSKEDIDAVDRLSLPEQFVAVHASSNEACRDWDGAKWPGLCEYLIERAGFPVVEIGTHPVIALGTTPGYRNLCGRVTQPQLAEVLRRATLFIGIDSGPAHFANAVGTPGVVLLGRYRHFLCYTPYSGSYGRGENCLIIRARNTGLAAEIPIEAAIEAASTVLAKFSSATSDRHTPLLQGLLS